jgi:hypothetical protein
MPGCAFASQLALPVQPPATASRWPAPPPNVNSPPPNRRAQSLVTTSGRRAKQERPETRDQRFNRRLPLSTCPFGSSRVIVLSNPARPRHQERRREAIGMPVSSRPLVMGQRGDPRRGRAERTRGPRCSPSLKSIFMPPRQQADKGSSSSRASNSNSNSDSMNTGPVPGVP